MQGMEKKIKEDEEKLRRPALQKIFKIYRYGMSRHEECGSVFEGQPFL